MELSIFLAVVTIGLIAAAKRGGVGGFFGALFVVFGLMLLGIAGQNPEQFGYSIASWFMLSHGIVALKIFVFER